MPDLTTEPTADKIATARRRMGELWHEVLAHVGLAERHKEAAKDATRLAASAQKLHGEYAAFLGGYGSYPSEQLVIDLPPEAA